MIITDIKKKEVDGILVFLLISIFPFKHAISGRDLFPSG